MKKSASGQSRTNGRSAFVQRAQPGYYPGYSTLSQQKAWDEATRSTVTTRVAVTQPLRFFAPDQAKLLQAVIDRVMPQDDRTPERRIPILSVLDERLHKNSLSGFRYEDMPPDRDAYCLGLQAIDEMAQDAFRSGFTELMVFHQELILKSLHDGRPDPDHVAWKRMPVRRFWTLLLDDCVAAYYAHPWAWDEIGYGGPAYPRGYMRLENGMREPWEVDEARYEWSAPTDCLSDMNVSEQDAMDLENRNNAYETKDSH
jgi:hypothetical protein